MKKNNLKETALTCTEYALKNKVTDNRAIATVGDSLLSFIYLDYIYEISNTLTMEELTLLKKGLQENDILNEIGDEIFTEDEINKENNDLKSQKVYATIVEAYTYALFKEDGYLAARAFVINEVLSKLRLEEIQNKFLLITEYDSSSNDEYKRIIDFLLKGKNEAYIKNR